MEIINEYFPRLSTYQLEQLEALKDLYSEWNSKINVVSRKDIENIYERHILHSLSIAKFIDFTEGSEVMDLGTGGGFPAIPLAIFFPDVSFHAIDGTAKKIRVVNEIAKAIHLKNIKAEQLRAEENKRKYDFIVSRAVAPLDKLIPWSERLIKREHKNAYPNGLIALKGGDSKQETNGIRKYLEVEPLKNMFTQNFFDSKYLIYVQLA